MEVLKYILYFLLDIKSEIKILESPDTCHILKRTSYLAIIVLRYLTIGIYLLLAHLKSNINKSNKNKSNKKYLFQTKICSITAIIQTAPIP